MRATAGRPKRGSPKVRSCRSSDLTVVPDERRDPVDDVLQLTGRRQAERRGEPTVLPGEDVTALDAPADRRACQQHLHGARCQDVTGELAVPRLHPETTVEVLALQLDVVKP